MASQIRDLFSHLGLKCAKATQSLIGLSSSWPIICDNHPFLEGLHLLSLNIETFHNKVLSTEGNIFKACTVTWIPFKRALVDELQDIASELKGQTASQILPEVIS